MNVSRRQFLAGMFAAAAAPAVLAHEPTPPLTPAPKFLSPEELRRLYGMDMADEIAKVMSEEIDREITRRLLGEV